MHVLFFDWMTSARGQECYIESQKLSPFRQTAPPVQQMDCRRWMSSISFPMMQNGQEKIAAVWFVILQRIL